MSKLSFSDLPTEIRRRIWYFVALSHPRHLNLHDPSSLAGFPPSDPAISHQKSLTDAKQAPTCTQICRESRLVAATVYSYHTEGCGDHGFMLLNPLIDTIVLTAVEMVYYTHCIPRYIRYVKCAISETHMKDLVEAVERGNCDILKITELRELILFVYEHNEFGLEIVPSPDLHKRLEACCTKQRPNGPCPTITLQQFNEKGA